MTTYRFIYYVGKEEKFIDKEYPKLWHAIEGFWNLPEIKNLKLLEQHVSLGIIKALSEKDKEDIANDNK